MTPTDELLGEAESALIDAVDEVIADLKKSLKGVPRRPDPLEVLIGVCRRDLTVGEARDWIQDNYPEEAHRLWKS